ARWGRRNRPDAETVCAGTIRAARTRSPRRRSNRATCPAAAAPRRCCGCAARRGNAACAGSASRRRLAEQGERARVAVQERGAPHWTDLAVAEKPAERHRTDFRTEQVAVVVGPAEEMRAASQTREE